jgi:hypothetical protein
MAQSAPRPSSGAASGRVERNAGVATPHNSARRTTGQPTTQFVLNVAPIEFDEAEVGSAFCPTRAANS